MSNRYSLPLDTFNKHESVCIKEIEDNHLLVYISQTGEIVAKHKIPEGKGHLVKDRNHSRDRTKGVDAFIDTVANQFVDTDTEIAYDYLYALREKYPRYIKRNKKG